MRILECSFCQSPFSGSECCFFFCFRPIWVSFLYCKHFANFSSETLDLVTERYLAVVKYVDLLFTVVSIFLFWLYSNRLLPPRFANLECILRFPSKFVLASMLFQSPIVATAGSLFINPTLSDFSLSISLPPTFAYHLDFFSRFVTYDGNLVLMGVAAAVMPEFLLPSLCKVLTGSAFFYLLPGFASIKVILILYYFSALVYIFLSPTLFTSLSSLESFFPLSDPELDVG